MPPTDAEVRDDTPAGVTPNAWLVWDDNDYYGPHLAGVFETRDAAVECVRAIVADAPTSLVSFFVQGVAWGKY